MYIYIYIWYFSIKFNIFSFIYNCLELFPFSQQFYNFSAMVLPVNSPVVSDVFLIILFVILFKVLLYASIVDCLG